MIAAVEQSNGTYVNIEATPRCGDFCDACGDCLKCMGEDFCYHADDECHRWVIYSDGILAFRSAHPEADL